MDVRPENKHVLVHVVLLILAGFSLQHHRGHKEPALQLHVLVRGHPHLEASDMDHLPAVPPGTVHGLESVPYVCEKPYDGGPFLTYPVRQNRPEIVPDAGKAGKNPLREHEKLHPTPNKEFEAFCQTWLFFGLINELLGNVCRSADFVRPDEVGHGTIISTSRLRTLVEHWVSSVQDGSCTVTYEHVAKCLRLTHTTLMAAGPEFDLSVKFCIASVGELFEYAANKAFGIGYELFENKCSNAWRTSFGEATWVDLLGKSGWCPSQIEIMVASPASLQSMYFFASMHDSVSAGRHELCGSTKCVAYQTDLKNYVTRHATKDCSCDELYVNTSRLDAVLTTGALALLRIREAEMFDDLAVEVVPSQPDSRYLAFSHVWADGLGNDKANALPRCQLLRLRKYTQSLEAKLNPNDQQTELLFWCDTLCCPADPGEGKNRVLAQMKTIYERATCVLVVDASIRLCESEAMAPEETCARILASGWMRRLWTFQEGALSADKGRLWFQFHDQAVDFRSLWQEIVRVNSGWGRKGLTTDILVRMRLLNDFFRRETGADLNTVDAALRYRSVSVPSDEPLLIGTLLGLDVAGILNGSNETRIHRMWSLMPAAVRGVPKSILFKLGPRVKEEGYRWAPSSMLYHHEDSNATLTTGGMENYQGTPTEHGLMVQLSGYHIRFPKCPNGLPADPWNISMDENLLYMRDDEACWYVVRRRWPTVEGDYLSKDQFNSAALRSHENIWVTLLETDFQGRSDNFQQTNIALLTRLAQESNDVKYVHSYMHIHVFQFRKNYCELFEAAYRCAQKLAESGPAQQLADMSKEGIDMESPEYKAVFDALKPEIHRITASGDNDRAMATTRQASGNDDDVLFGGIVRLLFIGRYAIMGPRTPDSQQWCVD